MFKSSVMIKAVNWIVTMSKYDRGKRRFVRYMMRVP